MLEDAARRKDNRVQAGGEYEMVDLYLSLGSNQGDRAQNIENAVSLLNVELRTPYKSISSLLETEPWGFESDEKFLNAAVHYQLRLKKGYNPEAEGLMILEICKDIERRMGRTGEPQYDEKGERIYTDRPIDIDILFYGEQMIDEARLTVPHPRLHERMFVLAPLEEICPTLMHPTLGKSIKELKRELEEGQRQ